MSVLYECDRCATLVRDSTKLHQVRIPATRSLLITERTVDLCAHCLSRLHAWVQDPLARPHKPVSAAMPVTDTV